MNPKRQTLPPKRPKRRDRALLATAAAVIAVSLAACGKEPDSRTAGQQLDAAVEKTQQAAQSAGEQVSEGMSKLAEGAERAIDSTAEAVGDSVITAAVNAELARDRELSPLKIDVDTQDGKVALIGEAPNEKARQRAETLARGVDGVVAVENRLKVGTS